MTDTKIDDAAEARDYEAPRDESAPLKVRGVSRVVDEPRAVLIALSDIPTGDEIRSLDDFLRGWVPGYQLRVFTLPIIQPPAEAGKEKDIR